MERHDEGRARCNSKDVIFGKEIKVSTQPSWCRNVNVRLRPVRRYALASGPFLSRSCGLDDRGEHALWSEVRRMERIHGRADKSAHHCKELLNVEISGVLFEIINIPQISV